MLELELEWRPGAKSEGVDITKDRFRAVGAAETIEYLYLYIPIYI